MTKDDVKRIFNCDEVIALGNGLSVTIDDFLEIAGFKDCEPTKEAMLVFDGGTKGYYDLILQLSE